MKIEEENNVIKTNLIILCSYLVDYVNVIDKKILSQGSLFQFR